MVGCPFCGWPLKAETTTGRPFAGRPALCPGTPPRITWALPLPTIELAHAARAPAVFWLEMLDRLHFGTAFPLKEMSSSKSTNAWFATGGVVPVQTWVLL